MCVTDPTSVVVWCSHTGERSLDQRVCAPPCEAVHLRCTACGAAIGGCPFESADHRELLARRVFALIGDETLALLVLAIVEAGDEHEGTQNLAVIDSGRHVRPPPVARFPGQVERELVNPEPHPLHQRCPHPKRRHAATRRATG